MRDDKLIAALNKAKTIIDDGVSVCDMMDRKDAEQYLDAQEAIDEALAALQREWAVVPREFEAAMASSGPRSGHSVEVLFKDREGALEFYAALKGLGSDWVQRQLDYIAARKKAAPQTEEPRGINVSGHTYVRRSATSYVCRRCGHDMCREGPKPCANQQPEEAP